MGGVMTSGEPVAGRWPRRLARWLGPIGVVLLTATLAVAVWLVDLDEKRFADLVAAGEPADSLALPENVDEPAGWDPQVLPSAPVRGRRFGGSRR